MTRTRWGGSEAVPHAPTAADPRTVTSRSKLAEDPRLRTMWAGNAFARDFREGRGHEYMLDDETYTERQQAVKQPGACLHCHASVWVPYRGAGGGDLTKGFEAFNAMPSSEARKLVRHPVSCIDCHEPATMKLRVTRPGFLEGIRALKASQGVKDYDPNASATKNEMRAFVCGQCHVEYFVKGPGRRPTYPWGKGLKVEQIQAVYDEAGFRDWQHALTGAPVLKAEHPEFELWSQGIHARSGVTCVDCHMAPARKGDVSFTDHHVRSPLLNVKAACGSCHGWSEEELKSRVEDIQDRVHATRDRAMDALVELIAELKAARDAGRGDEALKASRVFQRRAQFALDFVGAEGSAGFHAPDEAMRILAGAIDDCRKGQNALHAAPARASSAPGATDATAGTGAAAR